MSKIIVRNIRLFHTNRGQHILIEHRKTAVIKEGLGGRNLLCVLLGTLIWVKLGCFLEKKMGPIKMFMIYKDWGV